MNHPHGTLSFDAIVPTSSSPSSSSTNNENNANENANGSASDIFKRRLSEVAWSHSMEVSEEKRYKMTNRYK
jgi:hypothetical protein